MKNVQLLCIALTMSCAAAGPEDNDGCLDGKCDGDQGARTCRAVQSSAGQPSGWEVTQEWQGSRLVRVTSTDGDMTTYEYANGHVARKVIERRDASRSEMITYTRGAMGELRRREGYRAQALQWASDYQYPDGDRSRIVISQDVDGNGRADQRTTHYYAGEDFVMEEEDRDLDGEAEYVLSYVRDGDRVIASTMEFPLELRAFDVLYTYGDGGRLIERWQQERGDASSRSTLHYEYSGDDVTVRFISASGVEDLRTFEFGSNGHVQRVALDRPPSDGSDDLVWSYDDCYRADLDFVVSSFGDVTRDGTLWRENELGLAP